MPRPSPTAPPLVNPADDATESSFVSALAYQAGEPFHDTETNTDGGTSVPASVPPACRTNGEPKHNALTGEEVPPIRPGTNGTNGAASVKPVNMDRIKAYLDEALDSPPSIIPSACQRPSYPCSVASYRSHATASTSAAAAAVHRGEVGKTRHADATVPLVTPLHAHRRGPRHGTHSHELGPHVDTDEGGIFVDLGGGSGVVQILAETEPLHRELMEVKTRIDELSAVVRRQRARARLHGQGLDADTSPSVSARTSAAATSKATSQGRHARSVESVVPDDVTHAQASPEQAVDGDGDATVTRSSPLTHAATNAFFEDDESELSRNTTCKNGVKKNGLAPGTMAPVTPPSALAASNAEQETNGRPHGDTKPEVLGKHVTSAPSSSVSSPTTKAADGANHSRDSAETENTTAPRHSARRASEALPPLTTDELQQLRDQIHQLEHLYRQRGPLLKAMDAALRHHADQGERWEADEDRVACYRCQRVFSAMTTRHHCRRCGRLCCGQCSQYFGTKQDTSVRGVGAAFDPLGNPTYLLQNSPGTTTATTTATGGDACSSSVSLGPTGSGGLGVAAYAGATRQPRVTVKTEYAAHITVNDALDEDESRADTWTYPVSLTPPIAPPTTARSDTTTTTTTTTAATTPFPSVNPSVTPAVRVDASETNDLAEAAAGADGATPNPPLPPAAAAAASSPPCGYDETDINDPDTIFREEESVRRSREGGVGSLGNSPFMSFSVRSSNSSHTTSPAPHATMGTPNVGPAPPLQLPPSREDTLSYAQQQQQMHQQKLQHNEVRICSACYQSCLRARKHDVVMRLRGANRYILDDGYYYYHVLSTEELANLSVAMRKPGTVRKRAELLTSVALERTADMAAAAPQYVRQTVSAAAQQAPQVARTVGRMGAYTVQKTRTVALEYWSNYRANGSGVGAVPGASMKPTASAPPDDGAENAEEEDIIDDGIESVHSDCSIGDLEGEKGDARHDTGNTVAAAATTTTTLPDSEESGIVESGPIRGVRSSTQSQRSTRSAVSPQPSATLPTVSLLTSPSAQTSTITQSTPSGGSGPPKSSGSGNTTSPRPTATHAETAEEGLPPPQSRPVPSAPAEENSDDEHDDQNEENRDTREDTTTTSEGKSGGDEGSKGGEFEINLPEER